MPRNYIPKSPENGGLTPEEVESRKKSRFLRVLAENGGFKDRAIKQCGTSRRWYNTQLETDEEFALTVQAIIDITNEELVMEARRRAFGYEVHEPLSNKGMLTGDIKTTRMVSDNLLMFLIKGRMPEYRDGPGAKKGLDVSDDEMNAAIKRYMAKKSGKAAELTEASEAVN